MSIPVTNQGHHERIEIQPVSSFCDIMLNVNDVSLLSRTISLIESYGDTFTAKTKAPSTLEDIEDDNHVSFDAANRSNDSSVLLTPCCILGVLKADGMLL
ncbi:hypothetical protein DCAR_0519049 [Daucus carota subsp. sativus]|uniref:Uncharacterized protein n=1 Tax=Daucus carota subsp. sativus TaxID=79200 RepID=A0A164XP54_DAUCS|nr:hypothetical protein DCAR_0519049 [Daucus carota subsp. sativus]